MPSLNIPSECIPDGATLFKTPERLAAFLRPMLARKRSSEDAKWALQDLEKVCTHALGSGVGEGNPDAQARVRLSRAMEKSGSAKTALRFSYGWAIYMAV